MNFKSYHDLSRDISKHTHKLQKEKYDLIVGIPRSGMIPAYMIALLLNINCTDITSLKNNTPLKHGKRRKINDRFQALTLPSDANKILLVDDSIDSGNSLQEELASIPPSLRLKITTLAIYSSSQNRSDIDLFFKFIPIPRAFEWNIFHHSIIENSCVDIDGVLCLDPTKEENDDDENYINFILNVSPLILPSRKIHSLVTSRLEKYRKHTEIWLKNNGIQYENLIMLDLPSKEERIKQKAHSTHKSNYYKLTDTHLFIESDKRQAKEISKIAKKVVYCVEDNLVYVNGETNFTSNSTGFFYSGRQINLKQLIISRLKDRLQRLYIKILKNRL